MLLSPKAARRTMSEGADAAVVEWIGVVAHEDAAEVEDEAKWELGFAFVPCVRILTSTCNVCTYSFSHDPKISARMYYETPFSSVAKFLTRYPARFELHEERRLKLAKGRLRTCDHYWDDFPPLCFHPSS